MAGDRPHRPASPVTGAYNFRDLGGIAAANGRVVRAGRLFRSDTLQALTAADVAWLAAAGLAAVVDLRLAEEVAGEGRGPLAQAPGLAYVNAPMAMASLQGIAPERALDTLYLGCLEPASNLPRAFEHVARFAGAPTIFHCAAGKDRTGLLAAMLLSAVGVGDDAIVADYLLSRAAMPAMLARFADWPRYREHIATMPPQVYAVDAAPLRLFLHELRRRHGDTGGWARDHGIHADVIAQLRRELLTDA